MFQISFSVFWTPSTRNKIFCIFGPKITYFHINRGQYVHLTPKKCFLGAYSTKCPWNAPFQYPDISDPVQGRVKDKFKKMRVHCLLSKKVIMRTRYSILNVFSYSPFLNLIFSLFWAVPCTIGCLFIPPKGCAYH